MPPLSPVPAPELVFGLVAPIGVDLGLVSDVLGLMLKEVLYEARVFRVTDLMREIPLDLPLNEGPYVETYRQRIAYANALRQKIGNDGLAALAISAIRAFRSMERQRLAELGGSAPDRNVVADADERDEEAPLPNQAYIIRQLKRPEEVALLRGVYGKQFILISAFAPETWRWGQIERKERTSRGGLISKEDAHHVAHVLISQDAKESQEAHGQNVSDAFPLGDVFIDATSRQECEYSLRRFVHLLFGNNEITPTHDEYGMYMAKSASLRSSDLSRQVGAAVFRASGEVATLGCNEVPKAGGGTYWTGDEQDRRDFVEGHDPNERLKTEVLIDILDRLKRGGHLSERLSNEENPVASVKTLLEDKNSHSVADSRIMDIIEFGRIIHAEMSAICDASRNGIPILSHPLISHCHTIR